MNVLYAAWGTGMSEALTPSWVLHSRKYRDTSLILDLLTGELGRVTVVSRGARSKGGRLASSLQPFRLFLASWRGKGELKTLTKTDFPAPPLQIPGQSLMIGMYVNELLVRLLAKSIPGAEGRHVRKDLGHDPSHRPAFRRLRIPAKRVAPPKLCTETHIRRFVHRIGHAIQDCTPTLPDAPRYFPVAPGP